MSYYKKLPVFPEVAAIVLGNIFHLIAIGIQIIFSVMIAIVMELFLVLENRMKTISKRNYVNHRLSNELELWRRHHELVCRLVDHINNCFGAILIVTFINICGGAVKYSTQLLNLQRSSWSSYFFILADIYSRLLVILIGSHRMQSAVM